MKDDIEKRKIGISDHIAKPINFAELEKDQSGYLSNEIAMNKKVLLSFSELTQSYNHQV